MTEKKSFHQEVVAGLAVLSEALDPKALRHSVLVVEILAGAHKRELLAYCFFRLNGTAPSTEDDLYSEVTMFDYSLMLFHLRSSVENLVRASLQARVEREALAF